MIFKEWYWLGFTKKMTGWPDSGKIIMIGAVFLALIVLNLSADIWVCAVGFTVAVAGLAMGLRIHKIQRAFIRELEATYAAMSDEEISSQKKPELKDVARECYDREVARRGLQRWPQPTNKSEVRTPKTSWHTSVGRIFFGRIDSAIAWLFKVALFILFVWLVISAIRWA